jgi:hypothetical protein
LGLHIDTDRDVDSSFGHGYHSGIDRDWIWQRSAMFVTGSELLTL